MWCFHHDFEKGIVGSWFSKINQRLGFWKLYHPAILALTSYPFKPIIFIRFFSIHCQAQLQFHLKLSWVRSIITVPDPSGWPANHPEKYDLNFFPKRKTISIFFQMEDNLNFCSRSHHQYLMEDDLTSFWMEDKLIVFYMPLYFVAAFAPKSLWTENLPAKTLWNSAPCI